MSVPVVESSSKSGRFLTVTDWSTPAPAGVVAGDLLLAIFDTNAASGSFSLAGWTAVHTIVNATSLYTLARIADGTEGATYAFASSTQRTGVAVVLRISGADTRSVATALGAHSEAFSNGASPLAVAGIDAVANSLLLGIGDTGFSGLDIAFSCSGFTKVVDLNTVNQEQIEVLTKTQTSTGNTGSFSWATSPSSPSRQVMVLAIPPAPPLFVNAATSIESANATSHPITVPAGVQVGDLLLLAFDTSTTIGVTHAPPAGWTAIDANHDMGGSSSPSASLWCKIATASEVAGQVVAVSTGTANTMGAVAIAAWRNVDPASLPLGWAVTNTGTTQVTDWTVDASAINITKTKTLAVFISAEDTSSGLSHNTTPPSGFTEVVDTLPGIAKGFEIAWKVVEGTNLGVLSASVSPAGRSITWVVAFNGVNGVIAAPTPPTSGLLHPRGWKDKFAPASGQLFPRRVVV